MIDNPNHVIDKVKTKEDQLLAVRKRHDSDYALWDIKKRVFDPHPKYVNVTSNDARSLADKIQSLLIAAPWQFVIKVPKSMATPEDRELCNQVEQLMKFAFRKADIRLGRVQETPIRESCSWHGLIRGSIALRVLTYAEKGQVVFDIVPLDPRWLTYESGGTDLSWVAYRTFRTLSSLQDEYTLDASKFASDKPIEVYEFYEREEKDGEVTIWNSVIGGAKSGIFHRKQGLWLKQPTELTATRIPVVIRPIATRPNIVNETGFLLEGYGDSIYAPVRQTYEDIDRMLSLVATQSQLIVRRPTVHKYDPQVGLNQVDWKQKSPDYPGAVIDIPNTDSLEPYPIDDIAGAIQVILGQLMGQKQRATLGDIDYGNLSFTLSGTAIEELKQAWDKILGTYSKGLSYVYTDACYMIIEQLQKGGIQVPIEVVEKDEFYVYTFDPVTLPEKYYINVDFMPRSPMKDLGQAQLFEMLTRIGGISKLKGREDILKVEDPDAEDNQITIERVMEQTPEMLLSKALVIFEKQGMARELEIGKELMRQMFASREPQQEGQPPTGQPPPPGGEVR